MTKTGYEFIRKQIKQMEMPVPEEKVSVDEWKMWAAAVAKTRDEVLKIIDGIAEGQRDG